MDAAGAPQHRRPATEVAGWQYEVRLRGLPNRHRPVLLY